MPYVDEDPKLCRTYLTALEVLSKPWNGMLIAVLDDKPQRFSELADRVPDIGDRMLSTRLKELERRGLVRRIVDHGPPVRVSYELTAAGRGFSEVAAAISRWGAMLIAAESPKKPRPPKKK